MLKTSSRRKSQQVLKKNAKAFVCCFDVVSPRSELKVVVRVVFENQEAVPPRRGVDGRAARRRERPARGVAAVGHRVQHARLGFARPCVGPPEKSRPPSGLEKQDLKKSKGLVNILL